MNIYITYTYFCSHLSFAVFQMVNIPAASDFGPGHLSHSMSGIGKAISMAAHSVSVL